MRWCFVLCLSFWQVCIFVFVRDNRNHFHAELWCAHTHTHHHLRFPPGGCSRYWRWACLVWTPTPCTPSSWTSARLMVTAGSMWTASGCLLGNLNPTVTAVCTSTPTLRTLVPTGWRLRCPSVKSNWPTNSMEVDRCCTYTLLLVFLCVSSSVTVLIKFIWYRSPL